MPLRRVLAGLLLSGLAAVCAAQEPVPLGDEFRVDSGPGPVSEITAGADDAGGFVVVWQAGASGATDVFARRYDASGAAEGASEFRVNSYTTGFQIIPAVAPDKNDGTFVIEAKPNAAPGAYTVVLFVTGQVQYEREGGGKGKRATTVEQAVSPVTVQVVPSALAQVARPVWFHG